MERYLVHLSFVVWQVGLMQLLCSHLVVLGSFLCIIKAFSNHLAGCGETFIKLS